MQNDLVQTLIERAKKGLSSYSQKRTEPDPLLWEFSTISLTTEITVWWCDGSKNAFPRALWAITESVRKTKMQHDLDLVESLYKTKASEGKRHLVIGFNEIDYINNSSFDLITTPFHNDVYKKLRENGFTILVFDTCMELYWK